MSRTLLLTVAVTVAGVMAAPSSAIGLAPPGDSVTGTAHFPPEAYSFDAHSGPAGENPTGTVGFANGTLAPVTCLTASNGIATVGISLPGFPSRGAFFFVEDNDGFGDRLAVIFLDTGPPRVCPAEPPFIRYSTFNVGHVDVIDVPTPRLFTHRECTLGGWARIGFKSRRQCDNFVRWQCNNGRHTYYGFPTRAACRIVINRT